MPTKTIIAVWRGHEQGVDGQSSADPDYRGTRYNLHYEQQRSSGQSAGNGAACRASAAQLIACAWPGNLHPCEEEAGWLDLQLGEYFYINKNTQAILKGKIQCLSCIHFYTSDTASYFLMLTFFQLLNKTVKSQLHLK